MIRDYRKYLICRIEFDAGAPSLYDCTNSVIESTNAMNLRYRKFRRQAIAEEDGATVWILTGILKKDKEEKIIQVGQCKNLTQMLSGDIRKDIRKIIDISNSKNKYSKLNQIFKELSFFEVELDDYNISDIGINLFFPDDGILKKTERVIKASYVEGMIAFENNCLHTGKSDALWNPSTIGLDGYFYSYFEAKKYGKE